MEPTAKLETITPAIAKELLLTNKNNRPLNRQNINRIISEIKNGTFVVNGETVKISKKGILLDSQHRMHAIIEANIPVTTFVVRGIDENVFKTIDTGKSRTAADVLAIEGVENAKAAAAVCKFSILFGHDLIGYAISNSIGGGGSTSDKHLNKLSLISNVAISDFYHKNSKAVQESLEYGYSQENKLTAPSILSGLYFICRRKGKEDADDFFHKLTTGEKLSLNSPIYVLREYLLRTGRVTVRTRDKYTTIAMVCKAWNLYRIGSKRSDLHSISFNRLKESFPRPQ